MTDEQGIGRRAVLCGAGIVGAATLAGCGGDGEKSTEELRGKEIAKTADIPVGGGKIYGGDKVVVTQPTQGAFKAFTAVCTHQGCTVGSVTDGLIKCDCHGSEFAIADGSVRRGPADKPLKEYPVQVKGGGIVVG
ncbi:Rieske-like 2Fe-2S protein [Actinomadura pelletieri DSM 43383]|uniref:Cytochrome bc1 complex Rieske iron-sulfur subunit n=1 Tax=Actinomadura pelletieri DSM 43383 TaxID=1120940 RepID=A0A495QL89_9ACTN|nr:Rieske (2Fe-2S) protein [Actinomadura pelletieri]RKS73258.1 Rieske-like 2Fe-2S protein [Actinomadura pelletieri DSM 43383]